MKKTATNTKTATPKTKVCARCDKRQAAANFSRYLSAKDGSGLNAWCKSCVADYTAEKRAWHEALDEADVPKADRRLIALALRAGLTKPIAAAKAGAKSVAKASARKAPKASPRKAPATA